MCKTADALYEDLLDCTSLLLTMGTGWRQSTVRGILTGNIIDASTGKALAGVTIALIRINDSGIYSSFASDDKGAFEITAIDFSYYCIRFFFH